MLFISVSENCVLRVVADGGLLVGRPFVAGESLRVAFSDAVELSGDNAGAIASIQKLSGNSLNKFARPLILAWLNLADGSVEKARLALAPLGENTAAVHVLAGSAEIETNDVRKLAATDTWIAEQPSKGKGSGEASLAVISIETAT